jgi:hypothetical protein
VPTGHFELSAAYEYQNSSQGQESDVPLAISWGVFDRFELLIEPVPYTRIRPSGGSAVAGLGDTEVTAQYLLLPEKSWMPAIAPAFEVKVPTAHQLQIGTRQADYRLYLIASKRIGDFDLHGNIGYTFVGEPSGVKTRNPIDLEFAIEWFIHPKFDLFAEVNYTSSSLRGGGGGESGAGAGGGGGEGGAADTSDLGGSAGGANILTAEIAGEELIGTVGARYHITPAWDIFSSVSYDNQDATLLRFGITWRL